MATRQRDRLSLPLGRQHLLKTVTFLTVWALSASCLARDSTADLAPAPWYVLAREALDVKNYNLAIQVLTQAPEKDSADWHNLMGLSLRSKTPAQWVSAEEHYKAALVINPMHLGALEYDGALLLMKKDVVGAEAMRQRLERACPQGCEELRDLQKSLVTFKATQ